MNAQAWTLLTVYLGVLLALAWPLGKWLFAVAEGRLPRWLAPVQAAERGLYRLAGVDAGAGMGWRQYAIALADLRPRHPSTARAMMVRWISDEPS